MDKVSKERINILAGKSTIEFFLRSKAMKVVDSASKLHPMIKLYFDSELKSDIEKSTLMGMSEAIIWAIEKFTEKGPLAKYRSIGVSIAQTLNSRLYLAKLIHHANTGRITEEQFYELTAEFITAETVNMINQLYDFFGKDIPKMCAGLQRVLESFNIKPDTAKWITELIENTTSVAISYVKRFLTEERVQNIVYSAIKFTVKSTRTLCTLTEKAVEEVKEWKIIKTIKNWGRNICKKLEIGVPDFLKEKPDHDLPKTIELITKGKKSRMITKGEKSRRKIKTQKQKKRDKDIDVSK